MPRGCPSAEKKVVKAAQAETPRAIEFLEKLVNINSGSLNTAGVKRVGDEMRAQLEPLGFQVEWIPDDRGRPRRAPRRASSRHRQGSRRGLLIGHMDTGVRADQPIPEIRAQGRHGRRPGCERHEGRLSIMVSALRAMKTAGTLDDRRTSPSCLSGDEELPGKPVSISRRDMRAAAEQSDVALEFESLATEDGKDMGTIARRGFTSWRLVTTAKSGHSSGVFSDSRGQRRDLRDRPHPRTASAAKRASRMRRSTSA